MVSINWRNAGLSIVITLSYQFITNEIFSLGLQLRMVRLHGSNIRGVMLQIPTRP